MDENRSSGMAKTPKGKVEEGVGRATGDAETRVQGQMKHAEGGVQDLYDHAKDSAGEAIDAVSKMPGAMENTIRDYIQNNMFTVAAIALGLGWLLGRSRRPF
jgi:uncharacterized protein YjbJ (UPF0337 family)